MIRSSHVTSSYQIGTLKTLRCHLGLGIIGRISDNLELTCYYENSLISHEVPSITIMLNVLDKFQTCVGVKVMCSGYGKLILAQKTSLSK